MTSNNYIVALGATCFDEYYRADEWVQEGDKLFVEPGQKSPGGMISNSAAVLGGYGDKIYLVNRMNDGASNQELIKILQDGGIDMSHILIDNTLPDAKCIIVLTPKDRTIFVLSHPKSLYEYPQETIDLFIHAKYIYTSMNEIRQIKNHLDFVDKIKSNGANLVFDVESSTFDSYQEPLFDKADIIFINEIAFAKYCDKRNEDECIKELLNRGCKYLVITLGAKGCTCYSKDEQYRIAGHKVEVKDTTGAGDTFNASFVHCLNKGMPIKDCAEFANAAGARSTMYIGARGGVTKEETILEFIKNI